MKKLTFKQKLLGAAIAVAGLGAVAHTGHYFGLYDLTPFYNFINFNPGEFGWATFGSVALYFLGRGGYDITKGVINENHRVSDANAQRIVESEEQTQALLQEVSHKLDRNHELDSKRLMELEKIESTPDSLKELCVHIKDEFESDALEVLENAGESILDAAVNVLDIAVDKGADFVEEQLDNIVKKM